MDAGPLLWVSGRRSGVLSGEVGLAHVARLHERLVESEGGLEVVSILQNPGIWRAINVIVS